MRSKSRSISAAAGICPCSLQIAHSLEPYGIMWLEDPMLADNLSAYASLARETSIPICISERLATRYRFREMFEQHAVDVVMYDVTWCGGISEARKISDMADTYKIPSAPHTGGGPVLVVLLDSHGHFADQLLHHGERLPPLQRRVSALSEECPGARGRLCHGAGNAGTGDRDSGGGFPQRRRRDRDGRRIRLSCRRVSAFAIIAKLTLSPVAM